MSTHLSPAAARRVFLALTVTRWFPVGLVVGIMTLLPLHRGLSLTETLTALAVTGWVVFALELPTSSFADALGRRPVYVLASLVQVAAVAVLLVADSFWTLALGGALMGAFRALDSGPLEAWFVDTVHATRPGADVDGALAAHSTVLGLAIAAGALVSGGLVWWDPLGASSALVLPFVVYLVLAVVHVVAVLVLLKEPVRQLDSRGVRRALQSARQAPAVVREGVGMLRTNVVLRGLVAVELFWSVAMVVFETFQPIRLAELLGSEERAGAWMGPVAAAGWGVFAAGAALAGFSTRRIGVTRTAVLARVLNGLGVVVMGLVAGPVALVAAYLFTYSLHGAAGPGHMALLHREARASNRATVLSINSMVAFATFSLASPLLAVLATRTSTPVAMVVAGAFSVLGALCYLPARRQERRRVAADAPAPV